MPSIKDMVTRVDADIDPLRKALSDAGLYVDNFANRSDRAISKLSDRFKEFGKGAIFGGLTVAAAALTGVITSTVQDFGELADQADRIGILTDEMQVLRFAGVSVGAAIDVTDQSLARFVNNVGDAQQGTGALFEITKQYGIAVTDNNGKVRSSIDILGDLADVVRDADSAQERLRIATDAFGKQGIQLVPVLAKGKQGLEDFKNEAIALGVVIDKETIAKADEFGDAWTEGAYVAKIAIQAAMGDAFDYIDERIDNGRRRFQKYAEDIKQFLGTNILDPKTVQAAPNSTGVDPATGLARSRSDLENIAAGNIPGGLGGFIGNVNRRMGNLGNSPSPFPDPKKEPKGKLSDEQREAQKELNKLQELQNTLKMAGVEIDSQGLQQLQGALETTQAQGQAQQLIKAALEDQAFAATDLGKRLKDQLSEIGEAGKEVGRDLGFVFSSAFESAISSGGDLKSVLQGLLSDIAQIAARKLVTEPLGDLLENVFSSFSFANGGIMSSSGPLPLRAYSGGGVASSPQLALYGEGSMNEAYVPLPDGRRIPVALKGGGGGGSLTINQNNTFDARGADSSVLPQLQRMLDQNKRETIDAVAAKVGRGGAYAKKMGKR